MLLYPGYVKYNIAFQKPDNIFVWVFLLWDLLFLYKAFINR